MRTCGKHIHGNSTWLISFFLLVFAVIFIGGAWFLSNPRMARVNLDAHKAPDGFQERVSELVGLQSNLEEWEKVSGDVLEEARVSRLRSMQLQAGEVLSQSQFLAEGELIRLKEIQALVDSLLSSHVQAESERHESEAHRLLKAQDFVAALILLQKALSLQNEVNESTFPPVASGRKRAILLEKEILELQAEPLLQQSLSAEQSGKESLAAGRWDEAARHYREAFDKQEAIHNNHPDSRRLDLLRLRHLQTQLILFNSHESLEQLESLYVQAQSAVAHGRTLEGARMYRETAAGLTGILQQKPELQSVLQPRIKEGQKRATSSALLHFRAFFNDGLVQLDRHLASAKMEAALALEDTLRGNFINMKKEFPETSGHFNQLLKRLHFLKDREGRVASLQQQLREQFLAVPTHSGWFMMKTEVSQEFYMAIMDTPNPSRSKGMGLPVESVSHINAEEFAVRAGWLLGMPAQLPHLEHFQSATGPTSTFGDILLESSTGSVPVAGGTTGPHGFIHLWGNVSEWLATSKVDSSGKASHAGGHFLDTREGLLREPVRVLNVRDRSRLIGFRIVIKAPAQ